ncbi:frataxin-like domain protein (macronuclear) [Tetrahymena thermophila SB210]|uniref:Frataxin-like domain protein n=1 Tax=Tetrahymena thermophila (strain SB210) TaxID=312017 RepID=I7M2G8_TETTS|nr:frataxin-like domain protein [Tetrahymena thermophila SB210]EAS00363.2 frataxin-like domain protein [Tetrahymena thermophila SB210]|eukprot:XP_001020608.2 frataxin-like domain protein [Tetrahymena thermophila SB210]
MLSLTKRVLNLVKIVKKTHLIHKPQYNLLQNVDRLKSKPKIQEKPIPFIEKEDFQGEANLLLYRLEKAFQDLRQYEEKINNIDRFNENDDEDYKLQIDIKEVGVYQVYTDFNQRQIYLFSPISGLFKYYYDKNTEMWKSNKDEHFLIEHLTREISKYCKGYLQL